MEAKLIKVENTDYLTFYCPGCEHAHIYDKRWTFNGDFDKPSFTPSLLNTTNDTRCHLFVTDGKICYCGDCTHPLSGQTIELPEFHW